MASIIYRGTTIWNDSTNGAAFDWRPGLATQQTIFVPASIGVGYWLKRGNVPINYNLLALYWYASSPEGIRGLIRGVAADAGAETDTLSLPTIGDIEGQILVEVSDFAFRKVDGGYLVSCLLTFAEVP